MALSKHDPNNRSEKQYLQENVPEDQISTDSNTHHNEEGYEKNQEIQHGKETYIGDAGNIEDLRGTGGDPVEENSDHLTDDSGEEKKEEYINTDERKKDLDKNSRSGL